MRTIRNSIYKPGEIRYIGGRPISLNNAPMYVCICHAVTDRDIRSCIEEGASSMRELRQQLCVGTQCGKCACHVRALLQEAKNDSGPALQSAGCAA
jgi:bacterioferritin-associated ferredoxin